MIAAMVRAATLIAPGELEVRDYPMPDHLEPGAVLLRMLASGICGTDKHTFRGETEQYAGTEYARTTPFPIIQGHENVGVVEQLGAGGAIAFDGSSLKPGDRVVPAPNRACGRCRYCLRRFPYYFCRNLENYGNSLSSEQAPHLFGGWSEYLYLRPHTAVFRVPESLPTDIAVLTEIFAVTHSLERAAKLPEPAGWRPGDTVAVIGAGALGLAHAVKASLMGAGTILVSDPSAKRVELAMQLAGARPVQPADEADVVVNATGFPGSLATALDLVRDGGAVIEVGAFVDMGGEQINPAVLCARNLTLFGVAGEDLIAYDGTLKLLDRHQATIPFGEMVSHRFEIAEAAEAMQAALDPHTSAKVLIRPQA